VTDEDGAVLASNRDLQGLQGRHMPNAGKAQSVAHAHASTEVATRWSFDELPQRLSVQQEDASGWVYPALFAEQDGVSVQRFDDRERAQQAHARGLLRLAIATCNLDISRLMKRVSQADRLCLMNTLVPPTAVLMPLSEGPVIEIAKSQGPCAELIHGVVMVALEQAFDSGSQWQVRDDDAFSRYCERGVRNIDHCLEQQSIQVFEMLDSHRHVLSALDDEWPQAYAPSLADVREQLAGLVRSGFVTLTPADQRAHLCRYLEGARLRLQKLRRGGARDAEKLQQLKPLWTRFLARTSAHTRRGRRDAALTEYRWLLEEYRISLFAQELGTAHRVSQQRLDRLWQQIPP
jgi:ATP-dependent helicase HrpA